MSSAPAPAGGDCDVYVPVFFQTNDPANKRGMIPIYETDTIGDVRKRIMDVSCARTPLDL